MKHETIFLSSHIHIWNYIAQCGSALAHCSYLLVFSRSHKQFIFPPSQASNLWNASLTFSVCEFSNMVLCHRQGSFKQLDILIKTKTYHWKINAWVSKIVTTLFTHFALIGETFELSNYPCSSVERRGFLKAIMKRSLRFIVFLLFSFFFKCNFNCASFFRFYLQARYRLALCWYAHAQPISKSV